MGCLAPPFSSTRLEATAREVGLRSDRTFGRKTFSVFPCSEGIMSKRKTTAPSTSPNPTDKKLTAWLKQRATKLKALEAKGQRFKLDYVQNAKEKGQILLGVQDRIHDGFKSWVTQFTGIGYSTALLYMDVARNYPDVKKLIADSNPLELTLRQVRDAIRDARQERGEGKPGSGRPSSSQVGERNPDHEEDNEDDRGENADGDDQELAAPDTIRWDREATKAEAEAAEVEGGKTTEPESPLYAITVMVFSESDQTAIYKSLSNWSPTSKTLTSTKQTRSVSVHVPPSGIGKLLHVLGETLEHNQPQQVRVSIEL